MDSFESITVRQLLDKAAAENGDRTFIKFFRNDEIVEKSYSEVRENGLAVCRYIRSLSPERMHIALIGKTNYEYITCLTGVLISNNVAVPFAPDISVDEAVELFNSADIDALFYEEDFEASAREITAKCPRIKFTGNLGNSDIFAGIYEKYSSESEFAGLSDIEVDPDACAVIIFTSGTTGIRKGVMLSTNNITSNILYKEITFDPSDVALSVLPMHHIFCFTGDYLKNMKDGIGLCLNGSINDIGKNLQTFKPSVMRIVPMIAETLLRKIKMISAKDPSVTPQAAAKMVFGPNIKWIYSSGAYLNPHLAEEYGKLGIYLRQGYGMTESGGRISVPDENTSVESVGRVISICDVRIQGGEIQLNSPSTMLGYYKMPEETAEMFTEDGWLRTGDIGKLTPSKELFITGRLKNLIILSNGENISPEEIEKRFADCQLVKEVMVYGENNRIVAEIYPDYQYAEHNAVENIKGELDQKIREVNAAGNSAQEISALRIRSVPFERTSSGKIKRKEIIVK